MGLFSGENEKKCVICNEYKGGVWFDVQCGRCLQKNLFRVENRVQTCTHCGATLRRHVSVTADCANAVGR